MIVTDGGDSLDMIEMYVLFRVSFHILLGFINTTLVSRCVFVGERFSECAYFVLKGSSSNPETIQFF